ncbi:MAG: glycosyltransferase family 4 protein [Candidatus Methanofastidiosia archaeon]|jgi:glycosyltransferase involved in cell wall biosynthesis
MNVLMIGLYPPHVGGIASYVYNLKKELESLDITVYVVTYGKFAQFKNDPHVYGTYTTNTLRGVTFLAAGTQKAYHIAKEKDIDILHAHYLVPPGLTGVFTKRLCDCPLIITCHGSDIFVFSQGLKKVLSKIVVKKADCIVCNSEATLKAVHTLNPSHAVYIPSGVDLNRFSPFGVSREAITYVGALHPVKGVDTFLTAMHTINEKVWIVGDGPQREYLEQLASKLQIDCTFWGYRTDIPDIMNKSKIVVLPSKNEGFGLTLLEAMACKTPVIARNTGGIPELIKNKKNGLLFETEQELHECIRYLLDNKKVYHTLQSNGLKCAQQWSWERTATQYANLYSQFW